FMPAINASYSAWLLLALKAKRNDCSIRTPSGPSKTTLAPLPLRLDDPSTDNVHGCVFVSSSGADNSRMKSARICDLMLPLVGLDCYLMTLKVLSQSSGGDYHCEGELFDLLVTDLCSLEYPADKVYWLLLSLYFLHQH
ncbi:hypothetical protein A2U01_0012500, partial [Trifolium medium]|nr:hypothetical protein [Trifolium medium]